MESGFFWLLHVFDGCADCSVDEVTAVFDERIFLLWDDIMVFTFGMQEKLSFSVCLLKILCSGWSFGRHLVMMPKTFPHRFVLKFESHGGLYHVTGFYLLLFLFLFINAPEKLRSLEKSF